QPIPEAASLETGSRRDPLPRKYLRRNESLLTEVGVHSRLVKALDDLSGLRKPRINGQVPAEHVEGWPSERITRSIESLSLVQRMLLDRFIQFCAFGPCPDQPLQE